jgi:hypothetical protein
MWRECTLDGEARRIREARVASLKFRFAEQPLAWMTAEQRWRRLCDQRTVKCNDWLKSLRRRSSVYP